MIVYFTKFYFFKWAMVFKNQHELCSNLTQFNQNDQFNLDCKD